VNFASGCPYHNNMGSLYSDLRHSFRVLTSNPGFTSVAVAALALGIGANTAIFSVVNAVLLAPLPYPQPDQIMRIQRSFKGDSVGGSVSIPKFMAWKKANQAFQAMAIYDFAGPGLNLGSGDRPEQIKGIHVSAEYFQVFGVYPSLGRNFLPQEDQPNGPKSVILSHDLWRTRFSADPSLVGRPILLSGDSYTVAGVLPPTFHSDPPADVFIPMQADPNSTNQGHFLLAAGRLKPDVSLDSAKANMVVGGEQFRSANPNWMDKRESVAVIPLRDALVGDVRLALLILVGAVGFVLLIACANVANLLLARAAGRQREIAIRTAIGASRGHLVRQLLTESVLLSTIGGVLGLLIGTWSVPLLLAASPGNLPRINDQDHVSSAISALDWHVLVFTFAVALLTGVLFGLLPAIRVSKLDVNSVLKEASGRSGTGLRHNRVRSVLVAAEMALAVVLVAGAALMIRTFVGLRAVQPGFEAHNVITMQTALSGGRYDSTAKAENMTRQVTEHIEALPGVRAAASTVMLPVEGSLDLPFSIAGITPPKGDLYNGDEQWRFITPHYFTALHVPLFKGRMFDRRDTENSAHVLIINEAFAKKYWPQGDPIGQSVTIGKGLGPEFEDPTREVVGIVGNIREMGLSRGEMPAMYVPQSQVSDRLTKLANNLIPLSWIVETASDPSSLSASIQREIQAVDSQLAASKIRTMEQVISESTARENFNMLLLTIFAGLALLLAAIGIYGLMSYTVEQRTQEIGIRMALGADRSDMLQLVVRQGMLLAGIGVAVGLAASFGLTRLLAGLLFGVKTTDPLTYASVAIILISVAFLASYIPARRATKIDPLVALRYE
jgi:putative ABC transport system permease protein